MIITRTPFRISFCGGGSDIADFYREFGGCVLSATIDRYMYLSIHPYFDPGMTALKYSRTEIVSDLNDISHSIFHCVLNEKGISGVEITSTADVPSGTGLGSSSAFTVGLLHTLYCYQGRYVSKGWLAEEACRVEIERLHAPIGKQDQYAAAFGGMNFIRFHEDDSVSVEPVIMKKETMGRLQDDLIMFYTGLTHDAAQILSDQRRAVNERSKIQDLLRMCALAEDMKHSLENNDLDDIGAILDEGWRRKRELAGGISNARIDGWYDTAMRYGATGGKLLGAGGGGFLLFYCPRERQALLEEQLGLRRFLFKFEHDGTSVVYIGDKYWQ